MCDMRPEKYCVIRNRGSPKPILRMCNTKLIITHFKIISNLIMLFRNSPYIEITINPSSHP